MDFNLNLFPVAVGAGVGAGEYEDTDWGLTVGAVSFSPLISPAAPPPNPYPLGPNFLP